MRPIKFWDFDLKADHHPIQARRLDLVSIKKKQTCHWVYFIIPTDHRVKMKENKK